MPYSLHIKMRAERRGCYGTQKKGNTTELGLVAQAWNLSSKG